MKDIADQEVIDLDDNWTSRRSTSSPREQGGATACRCSFRPRQKVAKFVETVRGDNRPYAPVPPRQIIPTVQALAANAVMAGCKPEYFPVVTAALRGVLDPEYNLHGTLATTHSCAPMVMISGPIRKEINVNCGSNCFGQGWQANATIGRALGLMLLNVAGAKPGEMDRSTQGNPAKFTFCFGENEEENPWTPYHVQRGFAPTRQRGDGDVGRRPAQSQRPRLDNRRRPADHLRRRHGEPGRQHGLRQGPDVHIIGPDTPQTVLAPGLDMPPAKVVSMPSPVVEPWSLRLCGPSPDITVTTRRREAALHVIGRPGIFFLVLAEAEGELGGIALVRAVHFAGLGAGDVEQHQTELAAFGVGLPALAEAVRAAVDVDLLADRAADHDHRRTGMRRGQRAVQIVLGVEHAAQRGGRDREVFGPASRHHGVRRERLNGRDDLARRTGA